MLRFFLLSITIISCSCTGITSPRQARLKEIDAENQKLESLYISQKITQEEYSKKKLTLLDEKFYLDLDEEKYQFNKKRSAATVSTLTQQNHLRDRETRTTRQTLKTVEE